MGQETEERTVRSAEETAAQSTGEQAVPPAEGQAAPPPPQAEPNTAAESVKKLVRITSPEQVDDYIRVTTPGMWLLVIAILVLLAALIIWGFAGRVMVKNTDANGQVTTEHVAPASYVTDGVTGN